VKELTIVARFDDYVKSEDPAPIDELEKEIVDAGANAEERKDGIEIPERFKGKPVEEVVKSYIELEKLNSRQAQDLGQMRKTVDEILSLELRRGQTSQDTPENTKPVTVDDLYENPEETIRRVVDKTASTRVEALEKDLAQERFARAKAEFTKQFPKWEEDVHSPELISWIHAKPHRVSLARRADSGDFGAAEELFGTYYDQLEAKQQKQSKEDRKRQVKEASLESSGAAVPDEVEVFNRTKLMDKRLAAKRGNREAINWLQANAERIAIAYEEGRVVD
jgi:hypothetical protein